MQHSEVSEGESLDYHLGHIKLYELYILMACTHKG